AEVAERILRIGSVEAEPAAAEHEAHAVAEGQPQCQVELEVRLFRGRAADRARVEDTDAVELAAVEQQLVEAAELPGGGDDVGRRDDAGEEPWIVRQLDDLAETDAEGPSQDRRHGRERRRARKGVHRHLPDVLRWHAIAEPAEPERAPDLVVEQRADAPSG